MINMKKITLFSICLLGAIVLNAQKVITVDNSPGSNAQYNDLQSAISDSNTVNGDIIYIQPSETSYGSITIDKSLTLIGFSHSNIDRRSILGRVTLTDGASNTRLSGLQLTDDYWVNDNTSTLTGLIIENCLLTEVYFYDAGADGVIIRGNVLNYVGFSSATTNFSNTLITNNIILRQVVVSNFQSVTVKNNVFLSPEFGDPVFNYESDIGSITVQNNILYYATSSTPDPNEPGVIYDNCLTYNIGSGNVSPLTGNNNLDNQNPLFVEDNDNGTFEAATDDFNLQAGSPAVNAGVDGENLGIFDGNGFTFNNFGFTNGIPTVNIQAISTSVAPGQNLNVIINTSNQ